MTKWHGMYGVISGHDWCRMFTNRKDRKKTDFFKVYRRRHKIPSANKCAKSISKHRFVSFHHFSLDDV